MTTKLISANMGMKLVLDVDGKQESFDFSTVHPVHMGEKWQPVHTVQNLCDFLNEHLGTEYVCYDSATVPIEVKIAKPKRIKAPKRVSQDEFNRRIKELQP